jgi:hypothetical protein
MAVFWVVAPGRLVLGYQRLRGQYIVQHQGDQGLNAMMMEAARTSETLVNSYQSTWRYNPKDSHLHSNRHGNLQL